MRAKYGPSPKGSKGISTTTVPGFENTILLNPPVCVPVVPDVQVEVDQ
jgi:hypothetical protein